MADSTDLAHTVQLEYHIDTGDAIPIRQSALHVPFVHRRDVQELLKDMEHKKVIQPSKSLWASPIVLVKNRQHFVFLCLLQKTQLVNSKGYIPFILC